MSSGGSAVSATVSSGGELIMLAGHASTCRFSGGTAVVSAGGIVYVEVGATDFGVLTNLGAINVSTGATLTISTTSMTNAGAIKVLGSGAPSATIDLESNLTLTGGGSVGLGGANAYIEVASGVIATLTNLNNIISGAGTIENGSGTLTFVERSGPSTRIRSTREPA